MINLKNDLCALCELCGNCKNKANVKMDKSQAFDGGDSLLI